MIIYSDTLHWSDISLNRDLVTELDLITVFDVITLLREVSIGNLQRVRLANRGRSLLRTPGPVPFGTCICSNVETIHSWTYHVYGPFEFRTSLGTSILFIMFISVKTLLLLISHRFPVPILRHTCINIVPSFSLSYRATYSYWYKQYLNRKIQLEIQVNCRGSRSLLPISKIFF